MLFLLNEIVLDLGVPADTLARVGGPTVVRARLMGAVGKGQAALFAAGSFAAVNPEVQLAIAAEIAVTCEANAALFVVPARARHPTHVAVRLASAPLTTLSAIQQRHATVGPDPAFINDCVWRLVGPPAAA